MLLQGEQVPVTPWRKYAVGGGVALAGVALILFMLPTQLPSRMEALRDEKLDAPYEALKPLHEPKRPPQPSPTRPSGAACAGRLARPRMRSLTCSRFRTASPTSA